MHPCSSCQRFIHARDAQCPFCGEAQHQAPSPVQAFVGALILGAAMLGSGCATDTGGQSEGGTTSTTSTTSTSTATTESGSESGFGETETDTGDVTDDSSDSPASFYAPSSDIAGLMECDPFFQDCPEGDKCVPYASTGGDWDANKCVPVTGVGMPGDLCTYAGNVEATDDCDETSHCWDVVDVEGMNLGVCAAFCEGTPDEPLCPEFTACLIANDGTITLCLDTCDPLAQDCGPTTGCFWSESDFLCQLSSLEIPAGEPCVLINDCEPGNFCIEAAQVPGCVGDACCASFCALDDLEACPDPELSCIPFFDQDGPPEYENVGLCLG